MQKTEKVNISQELSKIEINKINQQLKILRKTIKEIEKTDIRFRDSDQNLQFVKTKIAITKLIKTRQTYRNKIRWIKRNNKNET